jgi:hypothetical protein
MDADTSIVNPQTSRYWLSAHAHVCRTRDHVVLLDLKRDEYLGISESDSERLARYVDSWPMHGGASSIAAAEFLAANDEIVAQLLALDLLTSDRAAGRAAAPPRVEEPETELIYGYRVPRVPITWRSVLNGTRATLTARRLLRRRSLYDAVIHTLRRVSRIADRRNENVNLDRLREHVAVFRRLRPFLATARDACVFDSLTLNEYLAAHAFYPKWIFGTRTSPFAAHCWLQIGHTVLNDSPENARQFTPIMVL